MRVRLELDLSPDTRLFLAELARQLHRRFDRLEHKMSAISDYFTAQDATLTTINETLVDVAADVTALLARGTAAGIFSADEQALADAANTKLTALADALTALDETVDAAITEGGGDAGDGTGTGGPTPTPIR